MALYTIKAVALQDLVVSGPDPFASSTSVSSTAISSGSTITLPTGADWVGMTISDTDGGATPFEDTDQNLASPVTFNGTAWSAGIDLENEYSYVIRPVGSTDPADDVTIYVLQFDNGDVEGITADGPILRDVAYRIISGDSSPEASYADLVICFGPGTRIATPAGPRAVETLGPGDRVETLDRGPLPLAWVGRQRCDGRDGTAPVRIAPGALGNARALVLSQQHRILVPNPFGDAFGGAAEVLVPVKALAGRPGIGVIDLADPVYFHLLLDSHQVILAEGIPVESMYPGPMALRALPPLQRAALAALFPGLGTAAPWPPARPLVRPGEWARAARRAGSVVARTG